MSNFREKELRLVGETLYGANWQTPLARDLKLTSTRRIRQWLNGKQPIPDGVWDDLSFLLHERRADIDSLLDLLRS